MRFFQICCGRGTPDCYTSEETYPSIPGPLLGVCDSARRAVWRLRAKSRGWRRRNFIHGKHSGCQTVAVNPPSGSRQNLRQYLWQNSRSCSTPSNLNRRNHAVKLYAMSDYDTCLQVGIRCERFEKCLYRPEFCWCDHSTLRAKA